MDNEEEAVTRLRQGNIQGLEYLVNQYYFQALRVSFFITLDRDRSEDIVQTVFLHLPSKIRQFDLQRSFSPWLMRSVVNATLDDLRKNRNSVYIEDLLVNDENSSFEQMMDASTTLENQSETTELKKAIWSTLEELPPPQRAVVVFRYYLNMDETEMSDQLNAPKSSIKWWLRSAKQALRERLNAFVHLDQ
jgi:RNA polymerase sigma-70 factor, ECF subfamily